MLYYICTMKNKLIKVSTYARQNDKSLAWAYKQITDKKVKVVIIDKIKFIQL